MKIGSYLRDRVVGILAGLFCFAVIAWMMIVLGVGVQATLFVAVVMASVFLCVLVYDFVRRHRFYRELAAALQRLSIESRAYLVAELIDRPEFLEGEIAYDALRDMGKSMYDEVMISRSQLDGYRHYIELWIHEIKTPIAAARLMAAGMRGAESMKLRAEIDRIESYVEQALYYARSTSLEKDYAIREMPLGACVRNSVKKNASFLIAREVAPSVEVPDEVMVFADGKWLQFIIGQILVNAAKYDARSIRISTRLEAANSADTRTVLEIADDGCGIPSSDIESVFTKGFTGENGRKFGSSTGMGLYLCATMCADMGLGLSVASEEGSGTRVMISFPHDRRRLDILT